MRAMLHQEKLKNDDLYYKLDKAQKEKQAFKMLVQRLKDDIKGYK